MSDFRMNIPLFKINVQRHEVWGVGADETPDQAGEVFDYAESKPYIESWSAKVEKASGGKSKGNIRGQHGNVAAGRVIELQLDDAGKRVLIGAEIVDPAEWEKVEKGVYTGFSIGGYYAKRWNDAQGRKRYAGAPQEWSLVDVPNNHNAIFELVKADGCQCSVTSEQLRKGFGSHDKQKAAFANMKADGTYDEAKAGAGGGEKSAAYKEMEAIFSKNAAHDFEGAGIHSEITKILRSGETVSINHYRMDKKQTQKLRSMTKKGILRETKSAPFYKSEGSVNFMKSIGVFDLKKEGIMPEEKVNPETTGDVSTGPAAAEEQEELHEHDILKAKLAEMVDGKKLDAAIAADIWNAIMADEKAELEEEEGETAEEEAAEGPSTGAQGGSSTDAQSGSSAGAQGGPSAGAQEKANPEGQQNATLDSNNDAGNNPAEIAEKQNETPAPGQADAASGPVAGNAPVAAAPPAKPSMSPEATRQLVLDTLVQLGLAEKVGGPSTGSGQAAAVYQAVRPQMQKAAMTPDHTEAIETLQKSILAHEGTEQELRHDLSVAIAAIENLEKRGFGGIVVRELGADDIRLAKSQQIGVLNEMLQKAVDPGVRQSLQAEITALEIKNVRSQK